MSTFVIAIAGTSGAGKSTLIQHLVSRLGNANSLNLDDYQASSIYPAVSDWLEGGADPNQFETPQFEIAHARKILRKGDFLPWQDNPALFMQNLREHLFWYLSSGRDFYLAVKNIACRDCDLFVDGTLSSEQMADQVLEAVNKMAV